jgi:hypothetical protein
MGHPLWGEGESIIHGYFWSSPALCWVRLLRDSWPYLTVSTLVFPRPMNKMASSTDRHWNFAISLHVIIWYIYSYIYIYSIRARLLSVQDRFSLLCPIESSSDYNSILVTLTAIFLTAAKYNSHLLLTDFGSCLSVWKSTKKKRSKTVTCSALLPCQ